MRTFHPAGPLNLLGPGTMYLSYPPLVGPDDETVGLQTESFTTAAKYDSARTQISGGSAENLGFWPNRHKRK